MQTCIAAFQSMTQALGAQRALSRAAIRTRVVKLNANQTTRGCAYGLEFACAQQQNVKTILAAASIQASSYIGGGQP
ncbi:MAG: DUF3343 domain-containing protein [Clostridia bacterium]|nr:DUF3343 domain-containing protein [Clostridia bacterium]